MANSDIADVVGSLCFGDLVQVDWLDASEATDCISHECFDTPITSVGWLKVARQGMLSLPKRLLTRKRIITT